MKSFLTTCLALAFSCACIATPTKNPLGFVYDLPEGWKVVAQKDVFQVVQRPGQTANELYIVGGLLAMGAKSPLDKSLIDADEKFMKELGPWSRLDKPAKATGPSGDILVELFEGTSQGVDFHGLLMTTLLESKRCGILAVMPKSLSNTVALDVLALAKSFRQDPDRKPEAESEIAKQWVQALAGFKLVRSTAADHGSLNGGGGESGEKSLILYQDGTFYYASSHVTFLSAGEFSAMSESKSQDTGQWSVHVEGEKLYLILKSDKGTSTTYELGTKGNYVTLDGTVYDRVRP